MFSTRQIAFFLVVVAGACAFSRPPRPLADTAEMSEDELSQLLMDELREGMKQDLESRPDIAKELNVPASEAEEADGGQESDKAEVVEDEGGTIGGEGEATGTQPHMDEVMERVRELQNQFQQLPKALKQLLWGNDSIPTEADLSALLLDSSRKPASGMKIDEEVACVVKCDEEHDDMPPADFGCEQLNEGLDCLAKCRPGAFADYSYAVAKRLRQQYCSFELHPDHATSFDLGRYRNGLKKRAQQCADSVLSDKVKVLRGVNHFVSCYIEMEEAVSAKEACYALKYCVLESTAQRIVDWCGDAELGEAMKSSSVHSMTLLSANGNLIRQCPILYETNF